jgi:hypothetical protein
MEAIDSTIIGALNRISAYATAGRGGELAAGGRVPVG